VSLGAQAPTLAIEYVSVFKLYLLTIKISTTANVTSHNVVRIQSPLLCGQSMLSCTTNNDEHIKYNALRRTYLHRSILSASLRPRPRNLECREEEQALQERVPHASCQSPFADVGVVVASVAVVVAVVVAVTTAAAAVVLVVGALVAAVTVVAAVGILAAVALLAVAVAVAALAV